MQAQVKEKIKADFNAAAGRYDAHAILQRDIAKRLCDKAARYLADKQDILDIGSGTGFISRHLPDKKIIQLDIALEMCQMANNSGSSINADMHHLPFKKSSFSTVTSSLALQWSGDVPLVCREMHNVLEDDGVCAIATFGDSTLHEIHSLGIEDRILPFITLSELKKTFANAGFEILLAESEISLNSYRDAYTLLYSIKNIGARNKVKSEIFLGKKFFSRLDNKYRQQFPSPEGGVMATWEVLYLIARKI